MDSICNWKVAIGCMAMVMSSLGVPCCNGLHQMTQFSGCTMPTSIACGPCGRKSKERSGKTPDPGGIYQYQDHYFIDDPADPVPYGHALTDAMWPWDDGESMPAVYDPSSEITLIIQGTQLDRKEVARFAFAPRAMPLDVSLPNYSKRTPEDVLDIAKLSVSYSD